MFLVSIHPLIYSLKNIFKCLVEAMHLSMIEEYIMSLPQFYT